jgi:putative ABC transport system substrate-binding protein
MSAEFSISAKWLELLREIAPTVRRVAVLQGPGNRGSLPQFAAIQTAASSLGMEPTPIDVGDAGELERSVDAFARSKDGGLIANRTSEVIALRDLIIRLAAKHRLPAVYPLRFFVPAGGLASYGPDIVDEFRLAAGYVDRILRGEKPADLPVQAPTKYELAVNLKTAKALGLAVSPSLLARADEVIE